MNKTVILLTVTITLFIVSFYTGINALAFKWSISEDYTHSYFVVPIIGYMLWQKREVFQQYNTSVIGLVGVLCSAVGYLVALQIGVPAVTILTTVAFLISSIIFLGGLKAIGELSIPILLLLLIIPIPLQLMTSITGSLQLWVSKVSAQIIWYMSIPLYREGNVLEVVGKVFQVVDACSGIRSLISMTTLSLIVAYFSLTFKRSYLLLFLFAIVVALLVNVARVVSMVVVYHYAKIDITHGTAHTAGGLLLFGFGLVLLFIFQRVLESWEIRKINS